MTRALALDRSDGRDVAAFDPTKAAKVDAQADALIAYAAKVKDFSLLEEAVDAKIDNQREFVAWWDDVVSPQQGGGRKLRRGSAPKFSREDAEERTRITHQLVSRWRRWINDAGRPPAMSSTNSASGSSVSRRSWLERIRTSAARVLLRVSAQLGRRSERLALRLAPWIEDENGEGG